MSSSQHDPVSAHPSPSGASGAAGVWRGAALVRRVEQEGRATVWIVLVVALAGAGRGVTPELAAGWQPVLTHALAGGAIWFVYSLLAWFVAHRMLGYEERFFQLMRVLGLPAIVLVGLWLNLIPAIDGLPGFSFALHGIAFLAVVAVLATALSVSVWRATAIGVAALAIAGLLMVVLGVPSAAGQVPLVERRITVTPELVPVAPAVWEEAWRSS